MGALAAYTACWLVAFWTGGELLCIVAVWPLATGIGEGVDAAIAWVWAYKRRPCDEENNSTGRGEPGVH